MSHLDRRTFLTLAKAKHRPNSFIEEQTITPLSPALEAKLAQRAASPPDTGLAPYTGPWGRAEVIHLLRRTLFGPTKSDVDYFQ